MIAHKPYVLYVEDDSSDALFLSTCWTDAEIAIPLEIEPSVANAVARFERADFANRQPILVLLDINLPVADGFQFLRWLRGRPGQAAIPVVMFSSSESAADMAKAYASGANGYVVKPDSLDALLKTLTALRDFWLLVNRVPGQPAAN
jgi:CheY-like chemotaxis protein